MPREDKDWGRTIAIPHCDECPPAIEWPTRSLILGMCPRCGRFLEGRTASRLLRAHRLIQERRDAA